MILGAKPQVVVCTLLNDVTPQDNRPPIPSPMDRPGAEHNHLRSYLTATEPSATIVHQIPLKREVRCSVRDVSTGSNQRTKEKLSSPGQGFHHRQSPPASTNIDLYQLPAVSPSLDKHRSLPITGSLPQPRQTPLILTWVDERKFSDGRGLTRVQRRTWVDEREFSDGRGLTRESSATDVG
uniref:Uncharacterized protein n=1 Tax=Timema shepardi TaxID=629360 RepID=A0A7R9G7C9_TIMSH|nr:unnamed protein product [Timema shepardi]